jgi:hypothetical protein
MNFARKITFQKVFIIHSENEHSITYHFLKYRKKKPRYFLNFYLFSILN